jgi:hypothetical protein
VEAVNPTTLAVEGTIPVEGGIHEAVIDDTATLWVASKRGTLLRIRDKRIEAELDVARPGARLSLALVGRNPVVADLDAGTVRRIDAKTNKIEEPIALPGGVGGMVLNAAANPGPFLWAMQADATLARVDLDKRRVDATPLGAKGGSFGPPVVNAGRVYVPDYSHHSLVAVDANTLKVAATTPVSGSGARFDVFVKDRAVWSNDPSGAAALVIDERGRGKTVQKGGRPPEDVQPESPPSPSPPPITPKPMPKPSSASGPAPSAPKPAAPPPPRPQAPPPEAPTVAVPAVVGQAPAQACALLAGVGLQCQVVDRGRGPTVGTVLDQAPGVGAAVGKGTVVVISVYGAKPQVKVPSVSGDPTQACVTVRSAGLQCVPKDDGPGGPIDKVRSLRPKAGTLVEEGSAVEVHYFGSPPRPIEITKALGGTVTTRKEVFFDKTIRNVPYGGFRVFLAGSSDGMSTHVVDDVLEITVRHPDGTPASRTVDYSSSCTAKSPTGASPIDLSTYFAEGVNTVQVILRDNCGTAEGSSDLWLVFKK